MDPILVTVLTLIVAVVLFITNLVPPPVTAVLVTLTLFLTGTLTFEQSVAGFGDPIIIYLACLFIVSESLDATSVTAWAGQVLVRRIGDDRVKVLGALMLLCAAFTALISVDGAVAALVPVAVMLSTRIAQPPSKVMIPLAFAAHSASMLTLLGSPINVIVSEMAESAGARPFGFFEFGLVGLPLVAGTIAIVLTFGQRLLPERVPENAPKDLSRYAERVADDYAVPSAETALSYEEGVAEAIITPHSTLIGETVFPGMQTDQGRLTVVGVTRDGRSLPSASLRPGDAVLLRGSWDVLDTRSSLPGIAVVEMPEQIRRQSVVLGARSYAAVGVLAAMCALLATGVFPPSIVVLIAAAVLVASRVLTVGQAQRSVQLTTLVVVAGMIPLSTAIQTSGTADLIANWLVSAFGGGSPQLLLLGIVLVVVVLGQFLSNLATVLIVAPIALSVAESAQISPLPLLMGIAVAAAAAFTTPIANTANLMIQGPGNYRFGDYWRIGLPMVVFFVAVATLLVPVIWAF
ncbi:SLC13 family permease [Microbacterium sp. NPDC057650]|uniref:SLC13 family permease n=1 Tax=unclassified Microbacterium TaxID=2609290 RepID=UPI0036712291